MPFRPVWTAIATAQYEALRADARASLQARKADQKKKAIKAEGLFKQVNACVQKLINDPRHPGLKTHKYDSIEHPYERGQPVFEAYVQNQAPSAYRLFWCCGRATAEITIIAITTHP